MNQRQGLLRRKKFTYINTNLKFAIIISYKQSCHKCTVSVSFIASHTSRDTYRQYLKLNHFRMGRPGQLAGPNPSGPMGPVWTGGVVPMSQYVRVIQSQCIDYLGLPLRSACLNHEQVTWPSGPDACLPQPLATVWYNVGCPLRNSWISPIKAAPISQGMDD